MSALSGTTPLGCLSPDLVQNTPRFGQASVPQSPSFPVLGLSSPKHGRQNSDVQGMVARFNSLDIKDHADLRKRDEAALKRAQMGREEAESELKKYREESRRLKKEQDEAKERERKVMKRIDVLMEELHRAKDSHRHAQSIFEKEIRRARKEAFKSSSAVVKIQEELKTARNQSRVAQVDLSTERQKAQCRDKDAFEAQCQILSLQDDLTEARVHIKVVEEERNALKMNLKNEEVMQIAAQGCIALPRSLEDEDGELSSPKTQAKQSSVQHLRQLQRTSSLQQQLEDLRSQLQLEAQNRALAQEQVEFMKLECQFGCCSCRIAELRDQMNIQDSIPGRSNNYPTVAARSPNTSNVVLQAEEAPVPDHSSEVNQDVALWKALTRSEGVAEPINQRLRTPDQVAPDHCAQQSDVYRSHQHHREPLNCAVPSQDQAIDRKEELDEQGPPQFDHSIDIGSVAGSLEPFVRHGDNDDLDSELRKSERMKIDTANFSEMSVRTVTHTTTVPLLDESTPGFSAFFTPGSTLTREEALERIRERRGRARSVTGTPKRSISVARAPRRDISAPEHGKTPKTAGKCQVMGRR